MVLTAVGLHVLGDDLSQEGPSAEERVHGTQQPQHQPLYVGLEEVQQEDQAEDHDYHDQVHDLDEQFDVLVDEGHGGEEVADDAHGQQEGGQAGLREGQAHGGQVHQSDSQVRHDATVQVETVLEVLGQGPSDGDQVGQQGHHEGQAQGEQQGGPTQLEGGHFQGEQEYLLQDELVDQVGQGQSHAQGRQREQDGLQHDDHYQVLLGQS